MVLYCGTICTLSPLHVTNNQERLSMQIKWRCLIKGQREGWIWDENLRRMGDIHEEWHPSSKHLFTYYYIDSCYVHWSKPKTSSGDHGDHGAMVMMAVKNVSRWKISWSTKCSKFEPIQQVLNQHLPKFKRGLVGTWGRLRFVESWCCGQFLMKVICIDL